jgi:hypothetical protein
MCKEFFDQRVQKNDDHVYHIIDVTAEQEKRKKNDGPQPKTRVQFETDDPEMYRAFAAEKDRIVKRAGNKSIAMTLMLRAWQWMTDPIIDKLIADTEGEPR